MAMKILNRNISDPLKKYNIVLQTKETCDGMNHGFRLTDNQIKTDEQIKIAITCFYYKRLVLGDRISTKPLNLCIFFQFLYIHGFNI